MQHRMLVVVLAAVVAALPIAGAQGSARSKVARGFVYGGVTSTGYPVVVELSKSGKKVAKATLGLELKCTTPGELTLPDTFKNMKVSAAGRFSHAYGPDESDGDPATGISKTAASGFITGKVSKDRSRITGTWNLKIVAYSAADPSGATILENCDSGVVKYTARQ